MDEMRASLVDLYDEDKLRLWMSRRAVQYVSPDSDSKLNERS